VIKFDGAKAKGLTYKEAIEVLGDEADGDLCIVTAEAAARMGAALNAGEVISDYSTRLLCLLRARWNEQRACQNLSRGFFQIVVCDSAR